MAHITSYHEWFLKKDIFGFRLSYLVTLPVLMGIGIVPVKPGTVLQGISCGHSFSIRLSYTDTDASGSQCGS